MAHPGGLLASGGPCAPPEVDGVVPATRGIARGATPAPQGQNQHQLELSQPGTVSSAHIHLGSSLEGTLEYAQPLQDHLQQLYAHQGYASYAGDPFGGLIPPAVSVDPYGGYRLAPYTHMLGGHRLSCIRVKGLSPQGDITQCGVYDQW